MRVLILGGGIGGHVAANRLIKKLGKEHEVVLVDKKTEYEFSPSFPWVMMGWRKPHKIMRKMSLLEKKGIKYINAEVQKINPAERTVGTSAGDLAYDYLIVSLGAELAPEAVPGFTESTHNFYTLEGATELREKIKKFSGGKVLVGVSSLPFKCPAAPYEVALLMDYHFRKTGIREKVDFQFFTAEARPMTVAPPEIGGMLKEMLEGRGISYHPNLKLTSVDPRKRKVMFEGRTSMDFDLLAAVPQHKPPDAIKKSELAGETGWIPVDKKSLRTKYDDVYAVGDVISIKLPNGKMLPKAGVFAHGQAEIVAHNIAAEVIGGDKKEFEGDGSCFFEIGYGKAAMAKGNFFTEPDPVVKLRWPRTSRTWHWYKAFFEKYWLWKWF